MVVTRSCDTRAGWGKLYRTMFQFVSNGWVWGFARKIKGMEEECLDGTGASSPLWL